MRSEDFYGKVEFLDLLTPTPIRHDARWSIRRATQTGGGVSTAAAILPDGRKIPLRPGKLVYVTNNGNPDGISGEYQAGVFGPFEVQYRDADGLVTITSIQYEQTGLFVLDGANRWRLLRIFSSVDFTAPTPGFSEVYSIELNSDANNIDVDEELKARGWDGVTDVFVEVLVRAGASIGSLDPSVPALRVSLTGQPSQCFLLLEPGAAIRGAGGGGGNGGLGGAFPEPGRPGQRGGTAVWAATRLSVLNGGLLGGGGGGGAGADGVTSTDGGAGGGGAGKRGGNPGQGGGNPPARAGTSSAGGQGGVPPGTGTIGIGGNGGALGAAGQAASLGAAAAGLGGRWLEYQSFGLPVGEQPVLYGTATQQYFGSSEATL